MTQQQAMLASADKSNIPIRRESVSDLTFKFGEKKLEEKNEIIILLRKIQNDNLNKEKTMQEMKTSIADMKKSVEAIVDLNLN